MREVRTTGRWIAVLAFLLAGVGGGGGVVLCFGAAGHVAVEAALNRSCSDFLDVPSRADSRFSPEKVSASTPYCCAPCVDLPTSMDFLAQRLLRTQDSQKQVPSPASFVSFAFAELGIADQPLLLCSPPVNITLLSLRTVVLLI